MRAADTLIKVKGRSAVDIETEWTGELTCIVRRAITRLKNLAKEAQDDATGSIPTRRVKKSIVVVDELVAWYMLSPFVGSMYTGFILYASVVSTRACSMSCVFSA